MPDKSRPTGLGNGNGNGQGDKPSVKDKLTANKRIPPTVLAKIPAGEAKADKLETLRVMMSWVRENRKKAH